MFYWRVGENPDYAAEIQQIIKAVQSSDNKVIS
jgi:hypothetical protein